MAGQRQRKDFSIEGSGHGFTLLEKTKIDKLEGRYII
jgi:hypothetical protein